MPPSRTESTPPVIGRSVLVELTPPRTRCSVCTMQCCVALWFVYGPWLPCGHGHGARATTERRRVRWSSLAWVVEQMAAILLASLRRDYNTNPYQTCLMSAIFLAGVYLMIEFCREFTAEEPFYKKLLAFVLEVIIIVASVYKVVPHPSIALAFTSRTSEPTELRASGQEREGTSGGGCFVG